MATVKDFQSLRIAGKHASTPSRALAAYHEASSQTFKQGALLSVVSGLVQEATNPVGAGSDLDTLVGIAAQAGQNVTTKPLTQIEACLPGVVFEGVLGNSADDLYALAAADADVGSACSFFKDPVNGGWYLNATTKTAAVPAAGAAGIAQLFNVVNARARVVGYKDPAGTVNGRVFFVFLSTGTGNTVTTTVSHPTIYN